MIDETSQRPDPVGAYTWLGANTPVRLEYNEAGVEMSLLGSGTSNYSGLDRFDRVNDIRWMTTATSADVARIQYGFDRIGNRTWRKDAPGSSAGYDDTYQYDGLYQVDQRKQGTLSGGVIGGTPKAQENFSYDRIGNWTEYQTRASGTLILDQDRTHNTSNEITAIDGSGSLVGYDASGNMTSTPQPADWSQKSVLTWDAWNRLISVKPGGSYTYDGMSRRIKKVTVGKARRYYYSDQWQILEEKLNSTTTTDQQYVWGVRYIDDLILRDNASTGRLYAMQDQWNVVAICNDAGTVVERYNYSAFGSTQVLAPDYTTRSSSSYGWMVTYASYQFDSESGFYQARYRYLHPSLGRWLSRDPIGENGGINFYAYVTNSPQNKTDSTGLAWTEVKGSEAFANGKGWKFSDLTLNSSGEGDMAAVIESETAEWTAQISVDCKCERTGEIKSAKGTRVYVYEINMEMVVGSPGSGPMDVPSPTSIVEGIGEVAAGVVETLVPKIQVMTPQNWTLIQSALDENKPTEPKQGQWKGKSPCEKLK